MTYYLIGCGGIGGWLSLSLAKTLKTQDKLVLIDGDKLEEKNLDRQLFDSKDIGEFKVKALQTHLEDRTQAAVVAIPAYLGGGDIKFDSNSWVLTGVDNHPARVRTLNMCDRTGSACITAANEYEDAEAFFYSPEWKGSELDPRTYYPEITEDLEGDPLAPPCTGEILESAPQLAIANMNAASYAMWLYWFWKEKSEQLTSEEAQKLAPVRVSSSAGRFNIATLDDIIKAA